MAEVYIIVHPDLAIGSLSHEDIRRIYLGKKSTWFKGRLIVLASLKKGAVHNEFLKSLIHKTPRRFSRFWKKIVFTGKGLPLNRFSEQQKLLNFVANTPNAIGYVKNLPETQTVRVVPIIGYSKQNNNSD